MAQIDTPDLDQQLAQATADLATAAANRRLAETTERRWIGLLAEDAVSRQDADVKAGDLAAKTALEASARANLDRLRALESFKRITAPFDGVVTTRSVQIGDLINVGGPASTPLFSVADEHRLRIYVRVPESDAAAITPGMSATFTVPQYAGRSFTATLATTADAIATQSGTLLAQLQIDNRDGALKPGGYAQVHFTLPARGGAIQAPANALMFRDSGMAVAVVGADGKVAMRPVTIGRDLGPTVEIASGITSDDQVILNPPDSLRPGDRVRIAPTGGANGDAGR
jgi:RND family efflux transporter MFP subunit